LAPDYEVPSLLQRRKKVEGDAIAKGAGDGLASRPAGGGKIMSMERLLWETDA
jgi:hypothetical protein